MSFYTKPPLVTVTRLEAQKAVQARFHHHMQLKLKTEVVDVENLDLLDPGNVMDLVSHHSLKLIAVTSQQFLDFFLESEVEFFCRRLRQVTEVDARRVLETAVEEARMGKTFYGKPDTAEQLDLILTTADKMLEHCAHAFHRDHPRDCEEHCLELPFTNCLQLVSKRAVELKRGTAFVYCSLWRQLLKERFDTFLRCSVKEVADRRVVDVARTDERVWPFLMSVKRQLCEDVPRRQGLLTRANLEEKSVFFPLCMKNVFLKLKTHHRLTHEARRAFTLFLKDAGMAVQEAIAFWATEYSRQAHTGTTCGHSWQKDYKKITYSIRHMYGLEGSRIHYTSFSCNKVQLKEAEMKYEVVCPFTEGNAGDLAKNLPAEAKRAHPTLVDDLLATPPLSSKGRCHLYQRTCHGCDSGKTFESPIGFYRCAVDDGW